MPSCPSCGADRKSLAAGAPCAKCGALPPSKLLSVAADEFELDVPKRSAPRIARRETPVEVKLELAVDPRAIAEGAEGDISEVDERRSPDDVSGFERRPPAPIERAGSTGTPLVEAADVGFDANLLARYGEPPRSWILSPLYAWRVLRRQRELKKALAGRRDEANRTRHEVDDALVALAERIRPTSETRAEFGQAIEELRGAEDVLRSRDRVLAAEQDAQTARLASVDARLAKLEADVAQAQSEERAIAAELTSSQAALARGEAKLKRAESELRSAMQREAEETRA